MNARICKKLIQKGRLPRQGGPVCGHSAETGDHLVGMPEVGNSGTQAERGFFSWFWEDVIGLSSESYCRAFWRAARQGYTMGPLPETLESWQRRRGVPMRARAGDVLLVLLVVGCPALVFYLMRRIICRHIAFLRRPTYYERERDRRIELGRQRRAITARTTRNPKPSFEAIRAAWNGARHSPEGALRLGGLLEDLECYVNNHARGNAATGYRGRYGGIKRLLEAEAPDLFAHYAALMRYKSIARRFRQACGLQDPIPADAVIPLSNEGKICSDEIKRMPREIEGWRFPKRDLAVKEDVYVVAIRILRACEHSVISLEAALALEIDPDLVSLAQASPMKSSQRVIDWLRRRTRAA